MDLNVVAMAYDNGPQRVPLTAVGKTRYGLYAGPEVDEEAIASRSYPPMKHHGFYTNREHNGAFTAQLCMDLWQKGETGEVKFRVVSDAEARQVLKARVKPAARSSLAKRPGTSTRGILRVDPLAHAIHPEAFR